MPRTQLRDCFQQRFLFPKYLDPTEFPLLITPEPEGGFTIEVPALPGCVTFGDTLEEAYLNALDAIQGYLEAADEYGYPVYL